MHRPIRGTGPQQIRGPSGFRTKGRGPSGFRTKGLSGIWGCASRQIGADRVVSAEPTEKGCLAGPSQFSVYRNGLPVHTGRSLTVYSENPKLANFSIIGLSRVGPIAGPSQLSRLPTLPGKMTTFCPDRACSHYNPNKPHHRCDRTHPHRLTAPEGSRGCVRYNDCYDCMG